jgi:hypothetical protein
MNHRPLRFAVALYLVAVLGCNSDEEAPDPVPVLPAADAGSDGARARDAASDHEPLPTDASAHDH